MSNTTIRARYQFTLDEFLKSNRILLMIHARPVMRIAGAVVMFVTAAIGIWLIVEDPTRVLGYFMLLSGGGCLMIPFLQQLMLRRAFRREPVRDRWIEWQMDEEGARVVVEDVVKVEEAWAIYRKVLVTPEGFFLYRGPGRLSWLPFKAFDSEADRDAAQRLFDRHIDDLQWVA